MLNFDLFADGDVLPTQVTGFTLGNAQVQTAGLSLNELEFPPRSGSNVIIDFGGPIVFSFASPATAVSVYVTYLSSIKLTAFDASNNMLGTILSRFSSNLLASGDPGSGPNEKLQLAFPGISSVTIAGDPGGFSFTLDDLTVSAASAVPEPSASLLTAFVAALFCFARQRVGGR